MAPEPVLEAVGLAKSYGDAPAVGPLDLAIPPGQLVALVGHNGSGKSTFLAMAAGLVDPTAGHLTVAGAPAGSFEARAAASFLPDHPVLYDDLSVVEHLEYVARLHGVRDWEPVARPLIERLGLASRADEVPSGFSRGMRQKASIALALVRPFEILLVDEPFVGLDPQGQDTMVELLAGARSAGAAVVVATHQVDFVRRADRCLALRDGGVIFDGPAGGAEVVQLVLGESSGP